MYYLNFYHYVVTRIIRSFNSNSANLLPANTIDKTLEQLSCRQGNCFEKKKSFFNYKLDA